MHVTLPGRASYDGKMLRTLCPRNLWTHFQNWMFSTLLLDKDKLFLGDYQGEGLEPSKIQKIVKTGQGRGVFSETDFEIQINRVF